MKFLSFNIQYSKGADSQYNLERIAEVIKGADIIGLQEVVRNLPGVPNKDQPAALSELLPEYFTSYSPSLDFDIGSNVIDGRAMSTRLQFGNMIMSRWPILSTRNFILPWSGLAQEHDMQNCALEAIIATPGGLLRVYCTHLNYRRSTIRREQMEWLVPKLFSITREGMGATGKGLGEDIATGWEGFEIPPTPGQFVVLGDFNFTPRCAEYSIATGESDFQYGRQIATDRWVDSWTQAGNENNGAVSWIDEDTGEGLKLDYGFVSPDLALKVVTAQIDADCIASDHKPYWFELDI